MSILIFTLLAVAGGFLIRSFVVSRGPGNRHDPNQSSGTGNDYYYNSSNPNFSAPNCNNDSSDGNRNNDGSCDAGDGGGGGGDSGGGDCGGSGGD